MPYEFFVGWRYLRSGRGSAVLWMSFIIGCLACGTGVALFFATSLKALAAGLMLVGGIGLAAAALLSVFTTFTAISVLGIAIGVSILIWVLSVTSGFQEEFRRKVLGVNAHILILKYGLDFTEYPSVIRKVEKLPEVVAASPFVFNEMMLARGQRLSGVLVKGVDPKRVGRVLDLPGQVEKPRRIEPHELPGLITSPGESSASRSAHGPGIEPSSLEPTIVIGRELANKLGAQVGDQVRLISPLSSLDTTGWSAAGEIPRSRDFRVSAIFYSGFNEYDKRLVYVHLREAQAFLDQQESVTGVDLKVRDVFKARPLARQITSLLGGSPFRTIDWSELNHNLFTALANQKVMLQIVIGFIVLVAAFNVLAALVLLVIRKTREISILKSMGMSSAGVARIFQSAGIIVWCVGTGLGLLWGYLGGLLLARYKFPLDPKVYHINHLPVKMEPLEFLLTAGVALAVCVLATLYPSVRAARMNPVEGLRYE